jgi:hypothetical protein
MTFDVTYGSRVFDILSSLPLGEPCSRFVSETTIGSNPPAVITGSKSPGVFRGHPLTRRQGEKSVIAVKFLGD